MFFENRMYLPQQAKISLTYPLMNMTRKRADRDKTTPAEAFIRFQIQVKRKEIEELSGEVSELESKNRKLSELWDQLRDEQLSHIRELQKQAKEQEKKLEQGEVENKEQVEKAQQMNIKLIHNQEQELAELCKRSADLQVRVAEQQQERQVCLKYKNTERLKYRQQIQTLQSELKILQKNYEDMSENIKCSFDATVSEIDKKSSQLIDAKKQQATEKAIKHLDKWSCQEIKENDCLKRVLAIYRKEVSILDATVTSLEQENLKLLKQLFEERLSDLQTSRNGFLTTEAELKQDDTSNMEQSLHKLTLTDKAAEPGSRLVPPPDSRAEAGGVEQQQAVELEGDETEPSCKPPSCAHKLPLRLYGNHNDLREPLNMDPLEQKLLIVVGRPMTLHTLHSDTEDLATSTHLDQFQTQEWSLTTRLIHKKFQ
ncbi:coiled-coil domain-containing protein 83 isoform X1 [Hoplias malabaricus]|uniref:coiled-coil domain-containing protein 83 isoform X1 n=1 Tax=Hoplias malabaricus TaxID=27720 RepID=UPI003463580C